MTLNFLPQKRCVYILATKMVYNLSLGSSAMDNSFMLSIFIGVFFDRKLNLIPHIKYIKYILQEGILQQLRTISGRDWCGDWTTVLRIYQTHIRSKMDYGCIAYGLTRRPYLTELYKAYSIQSPTKVEIMLQGIYNIIH